MLSLAALGVAALCVVPLSHRLGYLVACSPVVLSLGASLFILPDGCVSHLCSISKRGRLVIGGTLRGSVDGSISSK